MLVRMCPKCEKKMEDLHCFVCGHATTEESKLYWCEKCNIPLYLDNCSCGTETKYIATDLRPVFPEENLLISLILTGNPWAFQKDSVWYGSNSYIINGKKKKLKAHVDFGIFTLVENKS